MSPNVSIFKKGSRRTYLQKRLNSSVCEYSALSDYMLMDLALYKTHIIIIIIIQELNFCGASGELSLPAEVGANVNAGVS